jgi:hypothetical protein
MDYTELKEKYKKDIDILTIIEEHESFLKSTLYESVKTAKFVLSIVQKTLDGVNYINLNSEDKDVERIKMLMELMINSSVKLDEIILKHNIVLADSEEGKSYSDQWADKKRLESLTNK